MEILELHQENTTNIGVQVISNPTDVFAVVHNSWRKAGGFMLPAHITCGRCSVENEEVQD
jgi:hypothetical protein